jgi:hypothetical protein
MGFGKRLSNWSAASDTFERERDASLLEAGTGWRDAGELFVTILKVVAAVVAVAGTWVGIVIGRSLDGWSRPLGLAAPGWAVVLGAVVSALGLRALAVVLTRLDQIQRRSRQAP